MAKSVLIKPDKALRRRVLWILALLLVVGIWAIVHFNHYAWTLLRSGERRDYEKLLTLMEWVVYTLPLVIFGLAGWLFWLAQRIFQTGQFPLPGQRVIGPTPLRTGPAARRLAWAIIACGIVLIGLEIALTYYGMGVLRTFRESLDSPHVSDPVRLPRPSPR